MEKRIYYCYGDAQYAAGGTYLGEMIEFGLTDQFFIKPKRKEIEDYITGRFG